MRKSYLFIVMIVVLSMVVAACDTSTPTPAPPSATPEPTAMPVLTACLVTDVGTTQDGGFNQFAYEGLLKAVNDYSLNEPIVYESEGDDYVENIAGCIENNADIIVTVGFLLQSASVDGARANPDVYFLGVDQDASGVENSPPNYAGIQFREDEAGFLVGVLAALVANDQGSDVVAGIYGMEVVPAIRRFRNGYEQGVRHVNPDWEVGTNILGQYVPSFDDTELGQAAAEEYVDAGAAVIFGAGGPMGSAAIQYAATQDILVIGVDKDEYLSTFQNGEREGSEYLISSALKRVDQGVYDLVEVIAQGNLAEFPAGGNYLLDAAGQGIGFAAPHDADVSDEIIAEVRTVLNGLVSGDITTGVDITTGDLIEEE